MKTARSALISALLLAFSVTSAWSDVSHQARPGSINYVEGQASIGTQVLNAASVGSVELGVSQTLTTLPLFGFTGLRFFMGHISATGLKSFMGHMDMAMEDRAAVSADERPAYKKIEDRLLARRIAAD